MKLESKGKNSLASEARKEAKNVMDLYKYGSSKDFLVGDKIGALIRNVKK
jgi:hypothetical protein